MKDKFIDCLFSAFKLRNRTKGSTLNLILFVIGFLLVFPIPTGSLFSISYAINLLATLVGWFVAIFLLFCLFRLIFKKVSDPKRARVSFNVALILYSLIWLANR